MVLFSLFILFCYTAEDFDFEKKQQDYLNINWVKL